MAMWPLPFFLFCGVVPRWPCSGMPLRAAPLVGASGAVSGVLGAYLVLFPKARVWVLWLFAHSAADRGPVGAGRLVRASALLLVDDAQFRTEIAWGAHIGGFIAGAAITYAIRRRLWMRLGA
jgi:membrane associated rhomboid family serine protease